MPLLNSILSWVSVKRLQQINWYKTYPQDIQNELLFQLISDAKETVWGKKCKYAAITSIEDFQKQVPLNHYEDIQPYIERIRNGEQDVLWHTPIKWFAKSSGTTNDKSKFIPVSKESLENAISEEDEIRCLFITICILIQICGKVKVLHLEEPSN